MAGEHRQLIYAGQEVQPGSLNFVVALSSFGSFMCTGSLISPEHVLTAAHCMDSYSEYPWSFYVDIFRHNLAIAAEEDDECAEAIPLEEASCHPAYDADSYHNDICILHLLWPPRCASRLDKVVFGRDLERPTTQVQVAGWGETRLHTHDSTVERVTTLQVCSRLFSPVTCARLRGRDPRWPRTCREPICFK